MNTLKKKKELELTVARLTGEITVFSKQIEQMQKAIVDALYKRGLAYSQQGDRRRALVDLNIVIERDSSYAKAYYHRGVLYLHHKEWIKAKQDFTLARKGGVDIVQAFDEDFGGVVAFQQEYEFELPSDIVHLLKDG